MQEPRCAFPGKFDTISKEIIDIRMILLVLVAVACNDTFLEQRRLRETLLKPGNGLMIVAQLSCLVLTG